MANAADDKTWPSGEVLDGPSGKSAAKNEAGRDRTRIRAPRDETADYSRAGTGSRTKHGSTGKVK